MLLILFKYLAYLVSAAVVALVLAVAWQQLKIWQTLRFYRKQGVATHYHPIFGSYDLFSKRQPYNQTISNREYSKHLKNDGLVGDGILVSNRIASTSAVVVMMSPEYIKEFLIKEDNFLKSNLVKELGNPLGFFLQNGEKAW